MGNGGAFIERVNEGEKVGAVKQHPFEIDIEVTYHLNSDIFFDRFNGLRGNAVHVFPKPLARQLPAIHIDEPAQDRALEPFGDACFAAGRDTTVDNGEQKVVAHGGARSLFGCVSINMLGEPKPLGQVIQDRHGTKLNDNGLFGFGPCFDGLGWLCHCLDDVLGTSQILLPDDFGFSVYPFALSGVVVGLAADHLFSDACHDVGHTQFSQVPPAEPEA